MDQEKQPDSVTADKAVGTLPRKRREAEALRANLARRKAQIRQRGGESDDEAGAE